MAVEAPTLPLPAHVNDKPVSNQSFLGAATQPCGARKKVITLSPSINDLQPTKEKPSTIGQRVSKLDLLASDPKKKTRQVGMCATFRAGRNGGMPHGQAWLYFHSLLNKW